jgi:hypothetical protein
VAGYAGGRSAASSARRLENGCPVIPACPHCVTNVSVRADPVVEGRRRHYMCYCPRCEYVWEVYHAVPGGSQRRRFSRRRLATRRKKTLLRGRGDRRKRP